jgi:hypothetical protein
MRINSVPDVQRYFNNKNVLCVQSMVCHFVRNPVSTEELPLNCIVFNDILPRVISGHLGKRC